MIRTILTLAILAVSAIPVAGAYGAPSGARAVSLADASVNPRVARVLAPGASVTYTRACGPGRYLTEISAYRDNGRAMGAQRRTSELASWAHPSGGRVTFDGITFRNATRRNVIVAGWCS